VTVDGVFIASAETPRQCTARTITTCRGPETLYNRGVAFNLDNSIAVLERTPDVLKALLAGLSTDWTSAGEGPNTWSPFDVVGHLIDGEETNWMTRARVILSHAPVRRFTPFDRVRHLTASTERTLTERLDRFAALRAKNLADLRALALTPSDLKRTGEHPEFGSVTLEQLLATWVAHDLGHVGQIVRVMAKQYKSAVGPWQAYLPILHRRPSDPE
jgi:hypothetical protein